MSDERDPEADSIFTQSMSGEGSSVFVYNTNPGIEDQYGLIQGHYSTGFWN
jgi:hypothetical protein